MQQRPLFASNAMQLSRTRMADQRLSREKQSERTPAVNTEAEMVLKRSLGHAMHKSALEFRKKEFSCEPLDFYGEMVLAVTFKKNCLKIFGRDIMSSSTHKFSLHLPFSYTEKGVQWAITVGIQ